MSDVGSRRHRRACIRLRVRSSRSPAILFLLLLLSFVILPGEARAWGLSEPPCGDDAYYAAWPYNPAQRRLMDRGYGPPRTEPERTLDCIIQNVLRVAPDAWWADRIFEGKTYFDLSPAGRSSGAFTEAYVRALAETAFRKKKGSCGSRHDATRCGFEDLPPACDDAYRFRLYRTMEAGPETVLIRELSGTFRLVRENGLWKIDGSICSEGSLAGVGFNWKGQRAER